MADSGGVRGPFRVPFEEFLDPPLDMKKNINLFVRLYLKAQIVTILTRINTSDTYVCELDLLDKSCHHVQCQTWSSVHSLVII